MGPLSKEQLMPKAISEVHDPGDVTPKADKRELGGGKREKANEEELKLLRKVWARGPVNLEEPYEVMLHSSSIENAGLGVGIAHHVRIM